MSEEEDNGVVPNKITIRLDEATRLLIENVMRSSGLKASAAIRLLITLGAEREGKLEGAFKAAAWRTTAMEFTGIFQKKFREVMAKTFAETGLVDE